MKLKFKVLTGFLVLALMLSVAGVWSIVELQSISAGVQDILDDNYKSIVSAKMMLEALEREDSGLLLLMLGKWEEGRVIITAGDSLFDAGFQIAAHNLTIPDEADHVATIDKAYRTYKDIWERPIVDTEREGNLNWYFESVHRAFLAVKSAVNDLMTLNDEAMFATSSALRNQANRAIMPGIVAILAALAFSAMFSYFVNLYMVRPIVRITEGIKRSVRGRTKFDVQVDTTDELADLAESIRTLAGRVDKRDVQPGN